MKAPIVFAAVCLALAATPTLAATLKNTDSKTHVVLTQTAKKKEAIKMKQNDVYDSEGLPVAFYINFVRFTVDKDKEYIIKDAKVVPDPEAEKRKAEEEAAKAKETETAKPSDPGKNAYPPAAEPASKP